MTNSIGELGSELGALAVAVTLWCAGIVLVAFVVVRTAQRARQLRTAVAYLETARDAADFARQFKFISRNIETLKLLAAPWARFKSNLIVPQAGVETGKLRCTARPGDFFSFRSLSEGWPDYRVLPSMFLCFALLLTVAGFAASLSMTIGVVEKASVVANPGAPGAKDSSPKDSGANIAATQQQASEPGKLTTAAANPVAPDAIDKAVQNSSRDLLVAGKIGLVAAGSGLLISLVLTVVLYACSATLKSALQAFTTALHSRIEVVSLDVVVLERIQGASAGRPDIERTARNPDGLQLQQSIEQFVLPHIDAAIARVQDRLDRTAWESATTNSAAVRELVDEIGKLIERRVAEPALGIAELTQERLASISGQLMGLATLSPDRNFRVLPAIQRAADQNTVDHSEQAGLSREAPDADLNHCRLEVAYLSQLNDLGDRITGSLEKSISSPLQNIAGTVAAIEREILQVHTAIASSNVGSLAAAVPKSDSTDEFQGLLASLARSSSEIGIVAKTANERMASTLIEHLHTDIAHPLRGVSNDLREIRSALATATEKIAQLHLVGSAQSSQFKNEAAALRETIEAGNQRSASDARNALRSVENALSERIDASADSHRGVARSVSNISDRLVALDKVLFAADPFATVLKSLDDQGAQLRAQISAVLAAVRNGNNVFVQKHIETKDALAVDFAWNQRFEENVATSLLALTETIKNMRGTLIVAEQRESQSDSVHAGSVTGILQDMRTTTDHLGGTVSALMAGAQADADMIRQMLKDQIEKTADALGRASQNIEQSSVDLMVGLRAIVDQAPADMAREAQSVASALHAAVAETREQLGQTLVSLTDAKMRDDAQVETALGKINQLLEMQAEFAKNASERRGVAASGNQQRASEGNVLWEAKSEPVEEMASSAASGLGSRGTTLHAAGNLDPVVTGEVVGDDIGTAELQQDLPNPIELLKKSAVSSSRVTIRK